MQRKNRKREVRENISKWKGKKGRKSLQKLISGKQLEKGKEELAQCNIRKLERKKGEKIVELLKGKEKKEGSQRVNERERRERRKRVRRHNYIANEQ